MGWLESLDAVSTIRAIRFQAEQIQDEVLQNSLSKLRGGADPELLILEVARNLTNKLMHLPSSKLRNASAENREDLLQAAEELYNLKNDNNSDKKR